MIVRCGRCRVELEVAGAGEFACPNCGTRNVVRGDPSPFGVPDLGAAGGGSAPGLAGIGRTQPPPDQGPPPGVEWVICPKCSFRFAVGEVDAVECPTCGHEITLRESSSQQKD